MPTIEKGKSPTIRLLHWIWKLSHVVCVNSQSRLKCFLSISLSIVTFAFLYLHNYFFSQSQQLYIGDVCHKNTICCVLLIHNVKRTVTSNQIFLLGEN